MKKELKELGINKIIISNLKGGWTDPNEPDDEESYWATHYSVTESSGRFTAKTIGN